LLGEVKLIDEFKDLLLQLNWACNCTLNWKNEPKYSVSTHLIGTHVVSKLLLSS
jgi:hypothetical protein